MEPSSTPQEYNENEHFFMDNVIFNIVFLSLIAIFVNVGNFLILAAFKKHHFVKYMDILIAFLALMDYIGSWVVLPIAIFIYAAPEINANNDIVERVLCKMSGIGFLFMQLSSTFAITLMTSDRFAAVKKPFFYRSYCEKRPKHIKIILIILSVLLLALSVSIVLSENESFTFRDGVCTFESRSTWIWGKLIILIISLSQIPIVICCYTAFLLTVRKLDRKRSSYLKRLHQPKPSNNGSCQMLVNRSSNREVNSSSRQKAPIKCSPPVARAIRSSKDLYVNRGSRLSGTVALVVGIYYIPWILMLASMMIEMFTSDEYEVLHYVATRLVFMDSIFNPFIYARMNRYVTAFREIACCPFRCCGCYTKPYPDGMTANEVHRIVNRLAFEEWESPGLNRRIYSKRKMMKNPSSGCYEESFSELTGNSRMLASNPHICEILENNRDVYEVTQNMTSVDSHRESKRKPERRQSDSQIIHEKSKEAALHQKSLSDGYLNLCLRQEDEKRSFRNDYSCKFDPAITDVDYKSMKSTYPGRLEININGEHEAGDLPIDNFMIKTRHDAYLGNEDKNNAKKSTMQENKPSRMGENNEFNETCECSSSAELSNANTVLYDELTVNNTSQQSAGYCMPDNSLERQMSQITHLQKEGSRHHDIFTTLSKDKDNVTVLLRTRVANIEDSRKINFQLEVLDPSGLIEVRGSEEDDNDMTLPAVSDFTVPNFVFSLKENRFIAEDSSRAGQKIKNLKINYTFKRLSGVDQDDNKEVVKLHEAEFSRNETIGEDGEDGDLNESRENCSS